MVSIRSFAVYRKTHRSASTFSRAPSLRLTITRTKIVQSLLQEDPERSPACLSARRNFMGNLLSITGGDVLAGKKQENLRRAHLDPHLARPL